MKLYEFIILILGALSLFDYIKYSIFRCKYEEIIKVTGEPDYVVKKRMLEAFFILIAIILIIYKIIF